MSNTSGDIEDIARRLSLTRYRDEQSRRMNPREGDLRRGKLIEKRQ